MSAEGDVQRAADEDELRLVDVVGELDRDGHVGRSRIGGGLALQASSPRSAVRYFRDGPSDRRAADHDRRVIYLEDTWRPLSLDPALGTVQHLEPPRGETARRVSYFVDGDLHVDSHRVQSFVLGGYEQIELRVRGDILIADDVYAASGAHLTFTAIKREDGRGGDIVLDDPLFRTLQVIEADLRAEGEIVDVLDPVVRGVAAEGVHGH